MPQNMGMDEAACCLTNPLTAQAFIVICQEKGYECIVHSAASSALGKMLIQACKKYGITLINIVRRQEQVDLLKELGAEHILDSSPPSYETDRSLKVAQLKPMAFFDPVAGATGSTILAHLPPGSTTYNYGALDKEPNYSVGVSDLIFKQKVLTGFWLAAEMQNPARVGKIVGGTFENLNAGNYKSTIAKAFPFEQFQEAIDYNNKNQTEGKVVLQNPNFAK